LRRPGAALAAAAAVAAGGCGTPLPDLFEVTRSGRDPNANVKMLVNDGGTVKCNELEPKALDGPRLLEARDLARELAKQAELAIELPPGEGATLRYRVKTEAGTVAFSDRSTGRPQAFNRLIAFTADVAENVCGLER
jgi:hypothetical protein